MERRRTRGRIGRTAALAAAAAVLAVVAAAARTADWPRFRGPDRTGKSKETGLLQRWPQAGPKLLWSVDGLGKGFTHVAVAEGLVHVTGMVDGRGLLYAYTTDGTRKWKADYGREWDRGHPGTRSVPTVHDGLVYVASGVGNVACFKADDGRPVWAVPVFERYDAPRVKWGWADSLLIDGDNLICTPCGRKATLVALHRKTGEEIWAGPDIGHKSSFCTPLMVTHGGRRMIVTMTDRAVVAFKPDDGTVIWQHPYKNYRGNHPDTPIYHDGWLYVTSGYGKGAVGLKLSDDGGSVRQVWARPRQDPCHGQAVLVDGYVYASSHQRGGGRWHCVELTTGRIAWEAAGVGKAGSVIFADGLLYCYSEDGRVGLVRPNPKACEVICSVKVPKGDGPHWAHPVVSDGRLYIRHGGALMCYDVADEGRPDADAK